MQWTYFTTAALPYEAFVMAVVAHRIADAHNDLLVELEFRAREERPFARYWLDQLRAGGVQLQICPVSAALEHLPESALRIGLEQVAACLRAVEENATNVHLVRTRADLAEVEAGDQIGLMLVMEGCEPLGYQPELADIFWVLGIRWFGLTWNRRNPFADGIGEATSGGLSQLGQQLVDRITRLGGIVDLAHASPQTVHDVLARTPPESVVVSHVGCRMLYNTPRNLSDDQMRAVAAHGGLIGIGALPTLTGMEEPSINDVVDHIEHALSVVGIEHVILGADFYAQVGASGAVRKPRDSQRPEGVDLDFSIPGLAGPADYPALVASLHARGYAGPELDALLYNNLASFLRKGLP